MTTRDRLTVLACIVLVVAVPCAAFVCVAAIEGIVDGRARQCCSFHVFTALAVLLTTRSPSAWRRVAAAALAASLASVGLAFGSVCVTPPKAWAAVTLAVLLTCGVTWVQGVRLRWKKS